MTYRGTPGNDTVDVSPAGGTPTLDIETGAGQDAIVVEHITRLVRDTAPEWPLDKIAIMDRNILRIATFELIGRPDVPVAVILDEAVELAKRFGTDDSGRFVNGVLSGVAKSVR